MQIMRSKTINKEYVLAAVVAVLSIAAVTFAVKTHAVSCVPAVSMTVSGACPVPVSSNGVAQKTVVQANTMQYTASQPIDVSKSVVPLYWNASGAATVNLPTQTIQKTTYASVKARGTSCSGSPVMTVHVNGVLVDTRSVTSTTLTDHYFTLPSNLYGGQKVRVSFTNDYANKALNCDRNLFIENVTFYSFYGL